MSKSIYKKSHKYGRWYISIVRKALSREKPLCYTERHHIFPVSLFGKNDNIVVLTAREHFIAHKLLVKIYTLRYGPSHQKTRKMNYAFAMMNTRNEIKNNSRMYQECRKAFSLASKGNKRGLFPMNTRRICLWRGKTARLRPLNTGRNCLRQGRVRNIPMKPGRNFPRHGSAVRLYPMKPRRKCLWQGRTVRLHPLKPGRNCLWHRRANPSPLKPGRICLNPSPLNKKRKCL